MVEEESEKEVTGVNKEETGETPLRGESDNYDIYNTDINVGDFTQTFEPSRTENEEQRSTENEVQPKKDEEGEVQPDQNVEKTVIDLRVEPDDPPPPPPQDLTKDEKNDENLPRATVIYRAGWGARSPKDPPAPPLKHPIDSIIFTHTGGRATECHNHLECSQRLQELQRQNMYEDGMPDIQYNFMVTSDSTIYEGRGWFHSASKDPMYIHFEGRSLDIAFIGDFSSRNPPLDMIKSALSILSEGVINNYITQEINFCPVRSSTPVKLDLAEHFRRVPREN